MTLENLLVNVVLKGTDKGATKVVKKVKKEVVKTINVINQIGDKTIAVSKKFDSLGKQVGKTMRNISVNQGRFQAEFLSSMFGFMVLQKAALRVTKAIFNNFKELTGEGVNPLTVALTRLEANFKFLSFAIVDAATPFLIKLADGLAAIAKSIAKMSPTTLKLMALSLASFLALTTLGLVGSQMVLFGRGLKAIAKGLGFFGSGDINKLSGLKNVFKDLKLDSSKKVGGVGADKFNFSGVIIPFSKNLTKSLGDALLKTPLGFMLAAFFDDQIDAGLKSMDLNGDSFWIQFGRAMLAGIDLFFEVVRVGISTIWISFKNMVVGLWEGFGFEVPQWMLDIKNFIERFSIGNLTVGFKKFADAQQLAEEEGIHLLVALEKLDNIQQELLDKQRKSRQMLLGVEAIVSGDITKSSLLDGLFDTEEVPKDFFSFDGSDFNAPKIDLSPTMEDLELASILMFTTSEEIDALGKSIREGLVPALTDEKTGINTPLGISVDKFSSLNEMVGSNRSKLDDILLPLQTDTTERLNNASAIQDQATAFSALAESLEDLSEAKQQLAAAEAGE